MAHNGDGTVAVTYVNLPSKYPMPDKVRLDIVWTADSGDGSFLAEVLDPSATQLGLSGFYLYYAQTVPGTVQPTSGYAMTIKDPDSFDVSAGALASLSNSSAQRAYFTNTGAPIFDAKWTVQPTGNSVNSANVTLRLYFEAN